jgi:Zn-dependent protease with chaperone function
MPASVVDSSPAVDSCGTAFVLRGEIPPRRLPLRYRLGLILSAAAMVLLPTLYLGLVALTGYGVWRYARGTYGFFREQENTLIMIFGYGGPIAAGLLLITFLIKPLFARAAEPESPATLDLDQQPGLRALLAAVCAKVGAPMPVRVDVDCTVNASARFRLGLLSLLGDDLVLTIGLPLVADLTAKQLAGVLAHELGHFAQGAAMRTTYIIRAVNGWFGRVVFERDTWDDLLAEYSRRLGVRAGIVLWVARGAIWLSRRLLRGLMYAGHAIACWQMRQMEFDADYYEVNVGGSADFCATMHELRHLAWANRAALDELGELWREHRLVDDFPGYIGERRQHLAHRLARRDRETAGKPVATRWSDTHPSDASREAAARALNLPGIFVGEGPARGLFHQFEELCREATAHYYRAGLELEYAADALLPTATAARPGREAAEAEQACADLLGPALALDRPVLWTVVDFRTPPSTHDPAALARQFAAARAEIERLRPIAEAAHREHDQVAHRLIAAGVGRQFVAARLEVDPTWFELDRADLPSIDAALVRLGQAAAAVPPALAEYDAAVHRWGVLVAGTARLFADSLPGDLAARVAASAQRLTDYRPWFRALPAWTADQRAFAFAVRFEDFLGARRNYTLLGAQCEKLRAIAAHAPALVEPAGWPLAPAHAPRSAKEQLERELQDVAPARHLARLIHLTAELYYHSVGRLVVDGLELERVLTQSELA